MMSGERLARRRWWHGETRRNAIAEGSMVECRGSELNG